MCSSYIFRMSLSAFFHTVYSLHSCASILVSTKSLTSSAIIYYAGWQGLHHVLLSLTSVVTSAFIHIWFHVSGSWLAWTSYASAINAAPYCIGLCLFYISVSSICLGNVEYQPSPLLDIHLEIYERYFCPSFDYVEYLPVRDANPSPVQCALLSPYVINCPSRCAPRWRDALECLMTLSNTCSSLVRRAFLHQSILFSFVSPLPAGRFSIIWIIICSSW